MAVLGATTLTGCSSIPDFIAGSSQTIFRGTNAPTGWTKLTDLDDRALRVVASGALSSGGSNPFVNIFTTRSMGGSVGGSSLAVSQITSHDHANGVSGSLANRTPGLWPERLANNNTGTGGAGGGGAHAHPFGTSAENFSVLYSDVIRCSKT
jgi:hypothetical protein